MLVSEQKKSDNTCYSVGNKGRMKRNVLVIMVTFFVISIVLEYIILSTLIKKNEIEAGNLQLAQVEGTIRANAEHEASTVAHLKKDYQIRAKSVAHVLGLSPKVASDIKELKKLASMLNIDEIHLFDNTGKIYFGTEPMYYGYSFDSGEQMGYFKPMLADKSCSMCQDVTPNTAEGKNMMYAIVWDTTGTFMVEVGIEPKRLISEMKQGKMSAVVSHMSAMEGVDIYVYDPGSGLIAGTTRQQFFGKQFDVLGFQLGAPEDSGYGTVCGEGCYYAYKLVGQYVVLVTSNSRAGWTTLYVALIIEAVYLLIMACLVMYLVKKLMSKDK